jgi:hypothetical protein
LTEIDNADIGFLTRIGFKLIRNKANTVWLEQKHEN